MALLHPTPARPMHRPPTNEPGAAPDHEHLLRVIVQVVLGGGAGLDLLGQALGLVPAGSKPLFAICLALLLVAALALATNRFRGRRRQA
jgi:hypothetical protein